jgi:hypothetical protein
MLWLTWYDAAATLPTGLMTVDWLIDRWMTQEYNNKATDLFSFFQTNDLRDSDNQEISQLREMLYGSAFRKWMERVTGITGLTDQVDMSAAIYTDASFLLCHDDHVEGRRIAYIIYFVDEQWQEADGGQLALFDSSVSDTQGRSYPDKVVKRITPARNSIAFFAVGDKSFHEVTEVRTDRGRMSLSGWFYGPPMRYTDFPTEAHPTYVVPQPFGYVFDHTYSMRLCHALIGCAGVVEVAVRKRYSRLGCIQSTCVPRYCVSASVS